MTRSFAGTVITEAGTHPSVAGLVYIAARAPDAGEDYSALGRRFPPDDGRSLAVEAGLVRRLTAGPHDLT